LDAAVARAPDEADAGASAPEGQEKDGESPAVTDGGIPEEVPNSDEASIREEADENPLAAAGEEGGASDEASASTEDPDEDEVSDTLALGPAEPLMDISGEQENIEFLWYILKVQVNREDSIRDALQRRVKIAGLEQYFGDIVVPTEDVAEYTKSGKRRIVKRKLYPGYIVVNMAVNDDTWFLVRDTSGIGDFTGSVGKPAPLPMHEVEKLLKISKPPEGDKGQVRTAIPFKHGDHVRVKDGHFQNFEGDVETVDEANGRVTVMISIFGRSTPVELEHWQIESV
jgi:transcriptional antiterminator NusG